MKLKEKVVTGATIGLLLGGGLAIAQPGQEEPLGPPEQDLQQLEQEAAIPEPEPLAQDAEEPAQSEQMAQDVEQPAHSEQLAQAGSLDQQAEQARTALEQGERATLRIPLHEERLEVTKEESQAGALQLSKRINERQQTVTVPVQSYEITVSRVAADEGQEARASFEEGETISIPFTEEEAQVQKRVVVREELVIEAEPKTEQQELSAQIRSEDLVIQEQGDLAMTGDLEGQQQGIGGSGPPEEPQPEPEPNVPAEEPEAEPEPAVK